MQVETIRPHQLATRYLDLKTREVSRPFDLVLAFGSLELLGLGRMGDGLHPWADIVAVARAWCLATPGARMVTALPVARNGLGDVVFNSHRYVFSIFRNKKSPVFNFDRIYGNEMLSLLLANWKVLDSVVASASDQDGDDYVLDDEKASVKVFLCKRRVMTSS